MSFRFFGKRERKGESADAFLDKAKGAVAQGEYGMAVGHFRSALRLSRPEEIEKYQQEFRTLWSSIESSAIRGMGKAGKDPAEFMTEGALAINTLQHVKECNDLFNIGGLMMVVMSPEELARVVNEATLKELQETLAPAPVMRRKKS
ncbi:MAG: hypothetical protein V4449_00015 [Patescibacteria group bacterium]